jgi:Leucine-rich repeat (LRR) protein
MRKYSAVGFIILLALLSIWSVGSATPYRQTNYDCSMAIGITVGDCIALVSLYNTANGSTWDNKTGWLQTNTPCTWFGITCEGNRVSRIDLFENDVSGSLPAELGDLKGLKVLRMRNNNLTGGIPSQILQNMPVLEEINLFDNELSSQVPNPSNLPKLKRLYLDNNKLEGVIPPGIATVTTLEVLDFGGNKIQGTIPDLSALVNLTELKLHDNLLTGPFPDVSGATSLVQIYLQNNELSGALPTWLGNLTKLKNLGLTNNNFTGTIPPQLGNATQLIELKLAFNKLTGTIPLSLGNLVNLTQFNIDGNLIGGEFPSSMTSLTGITGMDIGYNMIEATDPAVIAYLNSEDPNWAETQTIPPSNITVTTQPDGLLVSWDLIPYVGNGGNYEVTCASAGTQVTLVTTDKYTSSLLFSGLPGGTYTCSINTYTPPHNQNYNELTSRSKSAPLIIYGGGNNLPPNDLFDNPIVLDKLGEQNYSYNIANATVNTDPAPPTGVGNCNITPNAAAIHYDIPGSAVGGQKVVARAGAPAWYRRQSGEETAVDTAVVVYELTEGRQLSAPLGCDDDNGGGQSSISNLEFDVEANKLYRLVVWNEGAAPQGAVIEIAGATFDLISPAYNTEFELNQPPGTFTWKPIAGGSDSYSFQVARAFVNSVTKFYLLNLTPFADSDALTCEVDGSLCTLTVSKSTELADFLKFNGQSASYLWSVYAAVATKEYDSNQIFQFKVGEDPVTPSPTPTGATPTPTAETPEVTETANTPTASPTNDPSVTPTATGETSAPNFVSNGGFEEDSNGDGEPEDWKMKNSTKDKLKCDKPGKPVAYSGDCAFMFKGVAGENSRLQQTVNFAGATFSTGDSLLLSLYYNAKAEGQVKVKVRSTDGANIGGTTFTMGESDGYANVMRTIALSSTSVDKAKIQFVFRSASKKLFVDEVSLKISPSASLLPLP